METLSESKNPRRYWSDLNKNLLIKKGGLRMLLIQK